MHNSVYHPQSNSLEKLRSVTKRILTALSFELKSDWERFLPVTMFVLRNARYCFSGIMNRMLRGQEEFASPCLDGVAIYSASWPENMEHLRTSLTDQPVLRSPDYAKEFVIQCGASERGMGVVLCQKGDRDEEHPVLYESRKLTSREQAYNATQKECACIVWAVQKLSCYLAGSKFTIETNHYPLKWLQTASS